MTTTPDVKSPVSDGILRLQLEQQPTRLSAEDKALLAREIGTLLKAEYRVDGGPAKTATITDHPEEIAQARLFGGDSTASLTWKNLYGLPTSVDVLIGGAVAVIGAPMILPMVARLIPLPAIPMVPNAKAVVVESLAAFLLLKFGKAGWAKVAAFLLGFDALRQLAMPFLGGLGGGGAKALSQSDATTGLALSRNALAGV